MAHSNTIRFFDLNLLTGGFDGICKRNAGPQFTQAEPRRNTKGN